MESVSLTIDPSLIGSSNQRFILTGHLVLLLQELKITTRLVLKKGHPWTGKLTIARKK